MIKQRSPVDLIRLSIAIENRIGLEGDLRPLPGKDSTLFAISAYQTGYVTFFRYDILPDVRHQLEALEPERALNDHETVKQILAQCVTCDNVCFGKGYYFQELPTRDEFPDVVYEQNCYVVKVDGRPVSWAWAQDGSEDAVELAVETEKAYRRRGYARQTILAWASEELKKGKVAFYSHEVDNEASEGLARSLGVMQYDIRATYEAKNGEAA